MDDLEFQKLVKKFMKDEYTLAQAKYLAYRQLGEDVPKEIEKEVKDEELTLEMTGGYIPLKIKKFILKNKMNPVKSNPTKEQHDQMLNKLKQEVMPAISRERDAKRLAVIQEQYETIKNARDVYPIARVLNSIDRLTHGAQELTQYGSYKLAAIKDKIFESKSEIDETQKLDSSINVKSLEAFATKKNKLNEINYYADCKKLSSQEETWRIIKVKVENGAETEKYVIQSLSVVMSSKGWRVLNIISSVTPVIALFLIHILRNREKLFFVTRSVNADKVIELIPGAEVVRSAISLEKSIHYGTEFKLERGRVTALNIVVLEEKQLKPNPIKKQTTSTGDIRVFRTEDDKFVIIKKELKSYGIYPDGDQFKKLRAPNKKAALEKAVEILSRKNNPTPGMGIKRKRGGIDEVGEDIKALVVTLYTSGDSIERIARRVDLNNELVKQILAEKNVPVRKGGNNKKIKPNPFLRSTGYFFRDLFASLVAIYKDISKVEYGTDFYKHNIKLAIWGQGVLFNYPQNAVVTALMLQRIYDMKSSVPDVEYQLKRILRMVDLNYGEAEKKIAKIRPGSIADKAIKMFDTDNPGALYFTFLEERKKRYFKDFNNLNKSVAVIDFINFMRTFSADRYQEKHDVLIKEISSDIVKNLKPSEINGQELIEVTDKVQKIHKDAMNLVKKSSEYIAEYTNEVKDGHDMTEVLKRKYKLEDE